MPLTHTHLFHSHLENLQRLPTDTVLEQVGVGGLSVRERDCLHTSVWVKERHPTLSFVCDVYNSYQLFVCVCLGHSELWGF